MAEDLIGYQRLVERALRGVVRDALAGVAENGLPGRHHLYINFRTDHPGVVMADALRARYPREMTIVLQYEYWGLEVDDDGFGVTLSFSSVPQRLRVPFAAVKLFTDPTAEFGLQFTTPETEPEVAAPAASSSPGDRAESPAAALAEVEPPQDEEEEGEPAEKVVSLDRFRSK